MQDPHEWELYDAHEDSWLLAVQVRKHACGSVLDMGTGSGIQSKTASEKQRVTSITAADINPAAIAHVKQLRLPKTTVTKTDLFSNITQTYDTIIFNPPYLPQEGKSPIIALEGGKHGYEVIERFLNAAGDHLNSNGQILLLYSSLSKPEHINTVLEQNMLHSRTLSSERHFFEELFVVRIRKDPLRKSLERKGITHIQFLAKGHRGYVFKAKLSGELICIKVKNPASEATSRITNEARFLKKLNQHGIGPQLLFSTARYLTYRYIDGIPIREYLKISKDARKSNHAALLQKTLRHIVDQCATMDALGITKQEMHRPHKHLFIRQNKPPVMIDFERCYQTKDPKNVTQFCQYLRNQSGLLHDHGIALDPKNILSLAKIYSKSRTPETIAKIKKEIKRA